MSMQSGPASMGGVTFDVDYVESRNRVTTLFRAILAIPHRLLRGVWQYFAQLLAFVQWFIILFTGKRNNGIWDLQQSFMGYNGRVSAYIGLLSDPYPAFGSTPGPQERVRYELAYEEPANRLSNALRIFWIIPAAFIAIFVFIGMFFVKIVSWFAIVFTGKHPKGMFDFLLKGNRFAMALSAYGFLMTDTYPKFE